MLPVFRTHAILLLLFISCGVGHSFGQGLYPTATITVSGAEQSPNGVWDRGNITVNFDGYVEIVQYGQYSSNASLASALAAMFCRDYAAFGLYAKAGVNPSQPTVITFQLINGSSFGPLNVVDPSVSFSLGSSGFASSNSTADLGVATLTLNGSTIATSNYGAGSTAASIAQDLALTANSSLVTVTSEGANLYLQSKQTSGSFTYPYALSFSTSQSFSSSPSTGQLTGSTGASPVTVYS